MGPAYFQPPPGKTSSSSLGVLFVTLVEGKEMPRNVKGTPNSPFGLVPLTLWLCLTFTTSLHSPQGRSTPFAH